MARETSDYFGCVVIQAQVIEIRWMTGGLDSGRTQSGRTQGLPLCPFELGFEICR
jgi:hypothetical protein